MMFLMRSGFYGLSLALLGCSYETALDFPGDDRGTCWEFQEEQPLAWDDPTTLGSTPSELVEPTLAQGTISGAWREFPTDLDPGFSFSFEPDLQAHSWERRLAAWIPVPEMCRTEWRLDVPIHATLTPHQATLPVLGGPGRISMSTQSGEPRCIVSLSVHLEDMAGDEPWFDFVEEHGYGERPLALVVGWSSKCDATGGSLRLLYETRDSISGLTYEFGE